MNKAFFLDRDGVINIDHGYVHKTEEFDFLPGVFEACKRINDMGYKIIVVTNQAGIARGYYTEADFHLLTNHMIQQFKKNDVEITDVYFCPHHPDIDNEKYPRECDCRKPAPGMIIEASIKHDIDLSQSVMVGDKMSDIQAGIAAGININYGVKGRYEWPGGEHPFISVESLKQAVDNFFSEL